MQNDTRNVNAADHMSQQTGAPLSSQEYNMPNPIPGLPTSNTTLPPSYDELFPPGTNPSAPPVSSEPPPPTYTAFISGRDQVDTTAEAQMNISREDDIWTRTAASTTDPAESANVNELATNFTNIDLETLI